VRFLRTIYLLLRQTLRTLPLAALCSLTAPGDINLALSQDMSTNIELLKSLDPDVRSSAASTLAESWKDYLPGLIGAVNSFDGRTLDDMTVPDRDYLSRVTDVLRTIVVNDPAAIREFRDRDDDKTARVLIWAARSNFREMRVNSTFILASVADNTNVCIALYHLQQSNISPDGIINLLQVVISVSGYIYQENYDLAKQTMDILQENVSKRPGIFSRTFNLIDNLKGRLEKSINKTEHLRLRREGDEEKNS
jgi:hypothetical protein